MVNKLSLNIFNHNIILCEFDHKKKQQLHNDAIQSVLESLLSHHPTELAHFILHNPHLIITKANKYWFYI